MTLYRTGEDSPVVDELIAAARSGKEVTAVVELRARFDEAANIDLATRLQDAGANVVYGVVGYKAHAKLLLVVRREGDKLRRYVHLGTGNYHPETTRHYTDLGFLTADPDVGEDAHKLFQMLTGLGKAKRLRKLQQSPFALLDEILELIDAEADEARKGRPARIIGKMNALSEPAVIRALYRASQAGVRIDLIVRGLCCLRPGVPGVSETIRVRSIVDRFLEHSRVFYFHAGGEERVLCSSADWMERNLRRRVEIAYPVLNEQLRRRVIDECLEASLRDDARAWELGADGRYSRVKPADGQAGVAAQALLLSRVTSAR
jgi:polyphosphate kinase